MNHVYNTRQTLHLFDVLALCGLFLAIIEPANSHGAEKITVAGASTVQPIIEQAVRAFRNKYPDIEFVIGGGGSSHGIKSAGEGEVMLGMSSRDLKPEEKTKYPDLTVTMLGMDGIAIIVNPDNPLKGITSQQVQDLYTGKQTNWKDFGGNDSPVLLVSKEEGRSTLDLFLDYFKLEGKESGAAAARSMTHRKKGDPEFSKVSAQVIGPNREAVAALATKPNAIAYVSIGTAESVAHKGGQVKLLDLDNCQANVKNVANGSYPLRRPLNVLTKGEPKGDIKTFIDFLLGPEGQQIVAGLDFVPLAK